MNAKTSSGFTLIELLVTIAALAILISVGLPSFVSMMDRNKVRGAADAVYSDLQLARMEAIKRNADIAVSFQGSGGAAWCYAMTDQPNCTCTSAKGGDCAINGINTRVTSGTDFQGVTLSSTAATMSFDSARGIAPVAGTITLSNDSGRIQVQLNTLGRVSICSDNVGGYSSC